MATATQLQRIAALVDQVTPLNGKQRGMTIEADDWNTLVTVLSGILEIDHVQETGGSQALESHFAPLQHQHVGEVTSDWLGSDLQSGFGSLGIEARRTLAEMNARIQTLSTEVARLSELTQTQQKSLDRSQVVDLDRERLVRSLDTRLGTVDTLRSQVDNVSKQVIDVSKNVEVVLETRKILTDAGGNPIDLGVLGKDIKNLQEIGENLRGIDGRLVRLRDVELRLSNLEIVTETGGNIDLNGRIGSFVADAEERLTAKMSVGQDQLRAELEEANAGRITNLRSELVATFDTLSAEQIAAAETRFGERLNDAIATNNGQLSGELLELTKQDLAVAQIDTESRLSEQFKNEIARNSAQLQDTIGTDILGQVDGRLANLQIGMEQRFTDVQLSLDKMLDQVIPERISTALESVDDRIQERVKRAFSEFDDRLDSVIERGLERANLTERIVQIVDERLRGSPRFNREDVLELLDQELTQRQTVLVDQLRGELAEVVEAQKLERQTEFKELVRGLRADVTDQQVALRQEIGLQVKSEISTLRGEFNRTIDDRLVIRPIRGPNP